MTMVIARSRLDARGRFGASPLRLAIDLIGVAAGSIRRRWQARAHAALLDSLDDRTLEDIGVARPSGRKAPPLIHPGRAGDTMRRVIEECMSPR